MNSKKVYVLGESTTETSGSSKAFERASNLTNKSKAPFSDFNGIDLYDGDSIIHPSGERGVIFFDSSMRESIRWRVLYFDIPSPGLWLGNQVGPRGRAVKCGN